MTKLRRFFNRARPEVKELRMWRGILSSIQKSVVSADKEAEQPADNKE